SLAFLAAQNFRSSAQQTAQTPPTIFAVKASNNLISFNALTLGTITSSVAQQAGFAVVNSASFRGDTVAPNEIVSIFGTFQTQNNQSATANALPLPTTLAGMKVSVNGTDAGLFFAGPTQMNILVPNNTPDGQVTFTVTDSTGATRSGTVSITRTAPG